MRLELTKHAGERMAKYGVSEDSVLDAVKSPNNKIDGHTGRKINILKI